MWMNKADCRPPLFPCPSRPEESKILLPRPRPFPLRAPPLSKLSFVAIQLESTKDYASVLQQPDIHASKKMTNFPLNFASPVESYADCPAHCRKLPGPCFV